MKRKIYWFSGRENDPKVAYSSSLYVINWTLMIFYKLVIFWHFSVFFEKIAKPNKILKYTPFLTNSVLVIFDLYFNNKTAKFKL